MALQLYTLFACYINGALLAEEGQVSIDVDSNAQEVNTVAKGFAGLSPGAAKTTISIDNAIPASNMEFNPGAAVRQLQIVEITIFGAGLTLTTRGFIVSFNATHGVNQDAKLSLKAICEPAQFQ